MANHYLWKQLLDPKTLKAGWHLARADSRQDFLNILYYADTFTTSYDQHVNEIRHRLVAQTYVPSPLIPVEVPKSSLSIRPGSVPSIEDRIVLQTAILLLAPIADRSLPEGVYSYRLKERRSKHSIFKETDVKTADRKGGRVSKKLRIQLLKKVYAIGKKHPDCPEEQSILGVRRPLKGPSLRAFRRWITAHSKLNSHTFTERLIREIRINPDHRITRKLVSVTRQFPRKYSLESRSLSFLRSPLNIFPYQESEIIWAMRYLSRISPETISYCKDKLTKKRENFYVRIQSAYLLSRVILDDKFLGKCREIFREEPNPLVQAAVAGLLMQLKGKRNDTALEMIAFHPNDTVRKFGRLLREVRVNTKIANSEMKFILNDNIPWMICDYIPVLYSISQSNEREILTIFRRRLRGYKTACNRLDLLSVIGALQARADYKLELLDRG